MIMIDPEIQAEIDRLREIIKEDFISKDMILNGSGLKISHSTGYGPGLFLDEEFMPPIHTNSLPLIPVNKIYGLPTFFEILNDPILPEMLEWFKQKKIDEEIRKELKRI